jgi:hypothetical protein
MSSPLGALSWAAGSSGAPCTLALFLSHQTRSLKRRPRCPVPISPASNWVPATFQVLKQFSLSKISHCHWWVQQHHCLNMQHWLLNLNVIAENITCGQEMLMEQTESKIHFWWLLAWLILVLSFFWVSGCETQYLWARPIQWSWLEQMLPSQVELRKLFTSALRHSST